MSEIPGDLKFLKSHEWARVEGNGRVTVGISDHAQGLLGDPFDGGARGCGGRGTLGRSGDGMAGSSLGGAMSGPLGAVGSSTRGIGDTVRGALAQFPLQGTAPAGGK